VNSEFERIVKEAIISLSNALFRILCGYTAKKQSSQHPVHMPVFKQGAPELWGGVPISRLRYWVFQFFMSNTLYAFSSVYCVPDDCHVSSPLIWWPWCIWRRGGTKNHLSALFWNILNISTSLRAKRPSFTSTQDSRTALFFKLRKYDSNLTSYYFGMFKILHCYCLPQMYASSKIWLHFHSSLLSQYLTARCPAAGVCSLQQWSCLPLWLNISFNFPSL
jgi:hypothetical protein